MAVRKQQVAVATQQVAAGASHASAQVVAVRNLQHQAVGARTQVTKLLRQAQKANHVAHQLALKDQAALNSLKAQEASIIARILSQSGSDLHRSGVSTNGMLSYPLLGGGVLTSPYGYRINPVWGYWGLHDGDDFAAPCGTPEVAVQSGRVVSEYYSSVWGNRLFLDLGYIDGHNFTVIYNHMARYAVGVGAIVTRGQVVGYEGTTGWSTGCHIHFTVMRDGVAVDPMHYIA
jgi:murein DD-endopeptidase MepM/ murein hydrolase activator NlpD